MSDTKQIFPCTEVGFTCKDFNIGYIPNNTAVVITGLLSITTTADWPYNPLSVDIESHCSEITFDNGSGVYNQPIYAVALIPDSVIYIPFQIKTTECGKFDCLITYEFTVFNENEEEITCSDETRIRAYDATCDWQECLTGNSRNSVDAVFCNPEVDCSDDLCNNPALQRLAVLVGIDKALNYKIIQKDWPQVDALFKRGLDICDCIDKINPCPGCDDKKHNHDEDCGCSDCNDNKGGCNGC